MEAYRELERRFRRIHQLESIEDVLHWDTAAMMPAGAVDARGEQLALLKVLQHELVCTGELVELLDEAEAASQQLDDWQAANLREMRRAWVHSASVPADLVESLSRACTLCEARWRSARLDDDFGGVAPLLEEVVNLTRQVGHARAERLACSPYEALLDEYEPGARCCDIDPLLDELASFLPGFTEQVLEAQSRRPAPLDLEGPFPTSDQRRLGLHCMQQIGFDLERGRLDVSLHPFCGGTPDDVRITTRYDESDFASGLMALLHETGHALYQRGLPAEWRHQPVGFARSMGVHESQSLLIEMQVCRSRPFIEVLAPLIRERFDRSGPAWSADNLYRNYQRVARGLIRVEADEVTYPAHVIVRYRLEKALVSGSLQVAELPAAWQEAMVELLDLRPPDDRRGCLQDLHWYDGAFGYFPSYTVGAIIAAQLFRSAKSQNAAIEAGIAEGDFGELVGWLRHNVHRFGSRYSAAELVERATGSSLTISHYLAHLRARYLPET